jgi:hypothetical protein
MKLKEEMDYEYRMDNRVIRIDSIYLLHGYRQYLCSMIYPPPLSVPAVAEEPPAVADAEESPADAEESPADAEESEVKFLLKSLNASTAKSLIFSDCVLVSW